MARAGVRLTEVGELGLLDRFVSVGERIADLVRFAAVDYVDTLFQQGW